MPVVTAAPPPLAVTSASIPDELGQVLLRAGGFPEKDDLKEYVSRSQAFVRARHEAGAGGREVSRLTTSFFDALVARLFETAEAEYFERYPQLDQRMGILALGGYGRCEMAPYSDLDLLFLHPWKKGAYSEFVSERILYAAWDANLDIGYSHRTPDECVSVSLEDVKARSALLDARLVVGDEELWAKARDLLAKKTGGRHAERFLLAKLEEFDQRRARYGGTVYLVEPNVKEAEGGLRDVHSALWVAAVHLHARTLDDLVRQGFAVRKDVEEVEEAWDFLLRVRNEIHYVTGRRNDRLTFDLQDKAAATLGYRNTSTLLAVEEFMRDYYRRATVIRRFAERMVGHARPRPRRLAPTWMRRKRQVEPGFFVVSERHLVADAQLLEDDPAARVRVFRLAQQLGVEIGTATFDNVARIARATEAPIADGPGVGEELRRMLERREGLADALGQMHEADLLAQVVPEMQHTVCLIQHGSYHVYTVDAHTLKAVRELEGLAGPGPEGAGAPARRTRKGEGGGAVPEGELPPPGRMRRLYERIDAPAALGLAVLFHDLGKGMGGGHSEIGGRMVEEAGPRMGFPPDQVELAATLVRKHLYMSVFSQRRDLDDPDQINEFCREVGSPRTLDYLYLLTYADIRAVGPQTWTKWKAFLLNDLYRKARLAFESGDYRENVAQDYERRRVLIERLLSRQAGDDADATLLEVLPQVFFVRHSLRWVVRYAELHRQARAEGGAVAILTNPSRGYATVTIAGPDRPGLFRDMTGVLAAHGVNVRGAQLQATSDGIALDTFQVAASFSGHADDQARRYKRLRRDLLAVARGCPEEAGQRVPEGKTPARRAAGRRELPPRVEIDNHLSSQATVVDVFCTDRVGLLHAVADVFAEVGVEIVLAKIATHRDLVSDSFHVTTRDGEKLHDAALHDRIRTRLLEALGGAEAEDGVEASSASGGEAPGPVTPPAHGGPGDGGPGGGGPAAVDEAEAGA